MLGNAVFRLFSASPGFQTFGTVRSMSSVRDLTIAGGEFIAGIDVADFDGVTGAFAQVRPTLVINCVGLVKQLSSSKDPLHAIPTNSILPHRLARLCDAAGARLIHISTDCVFSGRKGGYVELDIPDAEDLYGRSKLLGEVDQPHAITLRTSIVGHELSAAHGLVEWFLSQSAAVRGFRRAVFSGLPTVTLARVIRDYVVPAPDLHGVYHVSSDPIDKLTFLRLVAQVYGRSTVITPDDTLVIDRSLNSDTFRARTGFVPPSWLELIAEMRAFG
jgi:dTDP-4-dehydrorhamnose reductase